MIYILLLLNIFNIVNSREIIDDSCSNKCSKNNINLFYDLPIKEKDKYLGYNDSIPFSDIEIMSKNLINLDKFTNVTSINTNLFDYRSVMSKVDYRNINNKNYMSSVKNQGQCGSCVSFSVIALVESMYLLQNSYVDLSERDLFFCKGSRDCRDGWYIYDASRKLKNNGVLFEHCCSYNSFSCCGNVKCDEELIKIKSYKYISNVNEIKLWLVNYGPLVTRMNVYQDFYEYTYGIYMQKSLNLRGGHAILLMGFDDNHEYWICKNSWGTGWGENGYFRIKYGESGILPYAYGYDVGNVTKYEARTSAKNNSINNLILILCLIFFKEMLW